MPGGRRGRLVLVPLLAMALAGIPFALAPSAPPSQAAPLSRARGFRAQADRGDVRRSARDGAAEVSLVAADGFHRR